MERRLPPGTSHQRWREIDGKRYDVPAKVCDTIGREWCFVDGDEPRPDRDLAEQFLSCRDRGVHFLLKVSPDKRCRIPQSSQRAVTR